MPIATCHTLTLFVIYICLIDPFIYSCMHACNNCLLSTYDIFGIVPGLGDLPMNVKYMFGSNEIVLLQETLAIISHKNEYRTTFLPLGLCNIPNKKQCALRKFCSVTLI